MMNRKTIWALMALLCILALNACKESIDESSRYVYKERTIADYLTTHEQFTDYVEIMKETPLSDYSSTSVYQRLTAYGYFTCFAPTNDAISIYMDSLTQKGLIEQPCWDSIPEGELKDSLRRVIVLSSILDGTETKTIYHSWDLPRENEEFLTPTMSDRKLSVHYSRLSHDSIYIDRVCPISLKNRDIETQNGLIHEMGYVINPSDETLGSLMFRWRNDPSSGYSVMGKLLTACNLIDTLRRTRDEVYEVLRVTGVIDRVPIMWGEATDTYPTPEHRKLGYTLFAETDQFWADALGKDVADITVEDVAEWLEDQGYYPDAASKGQYTKENNIVNLFVTYHLLPMRIPADRLVIHYNEKGYNYQTSMAPTIPVWAYYTTMGRRRLLELFESRESNGVFLNRFPELNNAIHGNYHEVSCDEDKKGIYVNTTADVNVLKLVNGMVYPITEPLVYTENTANCFARMRLRYNVLDFLPEMINNDLRGYKSIGFANDEIHPYFNDVTINSKETRFAYLCGRGSGWPNYQGDELNIQGIYDVTFRVPPVPRTGTYEIRMGVSTESSWRGICQVYFGTDPTNPVPSGIPVDMALGGQKRNLNGTIYDGNVGWEPDTDDDDYNAEVDKRMRNNGFMKGPEYFSETPGGGDTGRTLEKATRRIIVRQHMDAGKTYYLRFKSVQDVIWKQLFINYLEWCPKEVYDNPIEPEDIW